MPATTPLLQEGRYRITNEFRNGAGLIYDAYDTVSETNVVVREIPRRANRVSTVSRRDNLNVAFAEQAKVLTEIDHESLLHVRDVFSETGRQYVVVDPVDGHDLQALLDTREAGFLVRDVTAWADQLLDALHYLHTYRSPIIHRDIRPANIKLDKSGKIKLVALGLVGSGPDDNPGVGPSGQDIAYSPLEQLWSGLDAASQKVIISKYDERSERILKDDLDARSDIYSLGATLYHLVTANVPVDSLERSIEILEGSPDPLRSPNTIDPSVPVEISDLILKAMEIRREYRFDSAAIMRQVLRTALIRVKEREFADSEEMQDALDGLGLNDGNTPVESPTAISETERIRQRLQEAEAQRQLADKSALEAEKRLRESDSAVRRKVVPNPEIAFDDDLLGVLDSFHLSEAPAPKASQGDISLGRVVEGVESELSSGPRQGKVSEETDETGDVKPESSPDEIALEEVVHTVEDPTEWAESSANFRTAAADDPEAVQVLVSNDPEEGRSAVEMTIEPTEEVSTKTDDLNETATPAEAPVTAKTSEAVDPAPESRFEHSQASELADELDENGRTGFGFAKAAAIGAGSLLVLVIGGWILMSSETQAPAKATTTASPAAAPSSAPEPETRSAFQPSETPVVERTEPATTVTESEIPGTAKTAATATPKPKKPAPPKTPTQKKAVTVDDLINDN